MRRIFWRALFVGLVALVCAVVHPLAVALVGPGLFGRDLDRDILVVVEETDHGVVYETMHFAPNPVRPGYASLLDDVRYDSLQSYLEQSGDGRWEERRGRVASWAPVRSLSADSVVNAFGYGWPAVSSVVAYDGFATGGAHGYIQPLDGFALGVAYPVKAGWYEYERTIPTRVVWPGLFINWIAWTVMVLIAYLLVGAGRRRAARRRWAHGVCGACGYGVGDLGVCPECGVTRPAKAVSS